MKMLVDIITTEAHKSVSCNSKQERKNPTNMLEIGVDDILPVDFTLFLKNIQHSRHACCGQLPAHPSED